ncbi:hypothetical protein CDAR_439551 [Caerostris darwini]|uniref:Uncharacterized protein n=1 Tax=Caerostris darwini TaxID=1538125 RepID=A0AAV4MJB6_9ARAC|nr:hypothetical protein CDAR_439551 [Caerostris darwini]
MMLRKQYYLKSQDWLKLQLAHGNFRDERRKEEMLAQKPEAKRKTELHVTAAFKSLSPALALHLEHLLDASAFYRKHYRFSRPPGKPERFQKHA